MNRCNLTSYQTAQRFGTVPTGDTLTLQFSPEGGRAFAFDRILIGSPNIEGLHIESVRINGETTILGACHAKLVNAYFEHGRLRTPFVIAAGNVMDVTLRNRSSADVFVNVKLSPAENADLSAKTQGRLVYHEAVIAGSASDVVENLMTIRVPYGLSRFMLAATTTAANPAAADDNLYFDLRVGNDLVRRKEVVSQITREFGSFAAYDQLRIAQTERVSLVLTNTTATESRVSFFAEAERGWYERPRRAVAMDLAFLEAAALAAREFATVEPVEPVDLLSPDARITPVRVPLNNGFGSGDGGGGFGGGGGTGFGTGGGTGGGGGGGKASTF